MRATTTTAREQQVKVPVGRVALEGDLAMPPDARGLILFAHGSGSSRRSPRNRAVAAQLHEGGLGTLLVDLLTPQEEQIDRFGAQLRFDIEMLAERLADATDWLERDDRTRELPVGYFGASTGAAAALTAAARRADRVGAVVSRGGRPDLAAGVLKDVKAPVLLIVGGNDEPVIGLNRKALEMLQGEKRMDVIPGATHLFEEPGALDVVARLARRWFHQHLARPHRF